MLFAHSHSVDLKSILILRFLLFLDSSQVFSSRFWQISKALFISPLISQVGYYFLRSAYFFDILIHYLLKPTNCKSFHSVIPRPFYHVFLFGSNIFHSHSILNILNPSLWRESKFSNRTKQQDNSNVSGTKDTIKCNATLFVSKGTYNPRSSDPKYHASVTE
jgi:hypothetical protein